jgi:hypothetical protein
MQRWSDRQYLAWQRLNGHLSSHGCYDKHSRLDSEEEGFSFCGIVQCSPPLTWISTSSPTAWQISRSFAAGSDTGGSCTAVLNKTQSVVLHEHVKLCAILCACYLFMCQCCHANKDTHTRDTPAALTQTCKRIANRNDTYEHMHLRLSKKVPADCEVLPVCLPPPSGTTPSWPRDEEAACEAVKEKKNLSWKLSWARYVQFFPLFEPQTIKMSQHYNLV